MKTFLMLDRLNRHSHRAARISAPDGHRRRPAPYAGAAPIRSKWRLADFRPDHWRWNRACRQHPQGHAGIVKRSRRARGDGRSPQHRRSAGAPIRPRRVECPSRRSTRPIRAVTPTPTRPTQPLRGPVWPFPPSLLDYPVQPPGARPAPRYSPPPDDVPVALF
jgi:hypothetical protein